jgi:transcriptional regulator with XRE-family HTH domain
MAKHPFSTFLTRKFLEWQLEQGESKSQAEFANLIGVKRTSLTMWMNGDHLPENENVEKLANFLGPEVYDLLDLPRPNPFLQKINQIFERLSPEHQQKLAEDAERYERNNEANTKRVSKPRKT